MTHTQSRTRTHFPESAWAQTGDPTTQQREHQTTAVLFECRSSSRRDLPVYGCKAITGAYWSVTALAAAINKHDQRQRLWREDDFHAFIQTQQN